jgi:hypothetical protein
MKYLKRFNESKVLDQSIIDDCQDIVLELEDNGFETYISYHFKSDVKTDDHQTLRCLHPWKSISPINKRVVDITSNTYNKNWITFYFSKKEEFNYSDIEDVVERLKSYLSECGLKGKQVESKPPGAINNKFEIHFS